jgi:hypothetical protein
LWGRRIFFDGCSWVTDFKVSLLKGIVSREFVPLIFSSNIFSWALVSHPKVFLHITSNSNRYSNAKLAHHVNGTAGHKFSFGNPVYYEWALKTFGRIVHSQLIWYNYCFKQN